MSSWGPPQKPHAAPSSLLLPAVSRCLSEPGGPAVCSSPLRAHLRCSVPNRSTEEVAKTLVSQCITATGGRTQNGIASAQFPWLCSHSCSQHLGRRCHLQCAVSIACSPAAMAAPAPAAGWPDRTTRHTLSRDGVQRPWVPQLQLWGMKHPCQSSQLLPTHAAGSADTI